MNIHVKKILRTENQKIYEKIFEFIKHRKTKIRSKQKNQDLRQGHHRNKRIDRHKACFLWPSSSTVSSFGESSRKETTISRKTGCPFLIPVCNTYDLLTKHCSVSFSILLTRVFYFSVFVISSPLFTQFSFHTIQCVLPCLIMHIFTKFHEEIINKYLVIHLAVQKTKRLTRRDIKRKIYAVTRT